MVEISQLCPGRLFRRPAIAGAQTRSLLPNSVNCNSIPGDAISHNVSSIPEFHDKLRVAFRQSGFFIKVLNSSMKMWKKSLQSAWESQSVLQ